LIAILLLSFFTHAIENVDGSGTPSGLEAQDQANQEDAQNCSDIPKGGKRVVSMASPMLSTAPNHAAMQNDQITYKVLHPTANTYRILFPTAYYRGCDYDGSYKTKKYACGAVFDPTFDQMMRHRVQTCLDKMNKRLPTFNGARVEYAIYPSVNAFKNENDFPDSANPALIIVGAKSIRSNMLNYADGLPCEEIMHEMTHITGLPDLYPETDPANGLPLDVKGHIIRDVPNTQTTNYDCRPTVERGNLMNDVYLFEKGRAIQVTGFCICDSETCAAAKPGPITSSHPKCPKGYSFQRETESPAMDSMYVSLFNGEPHRTIFVMNPHPQLPPLLSAGQLRHMIYPGCQKKNQAFYRCAKSSYDTTTSEGCAQSVHDCSQDNKWLD